MVATARLGRWNPWLIASALAVCVASGVVGGIKPGYGVLVAVGILFAVAVITDVTLGFVLFTVLSFLDLFSSTGSVSVTKAIGLILFVSWLVRIAAQRGRDLAAFISEHAALVVALIAMLAWSALSFVWAYSPGTALGGAGRYLLDMMLIPIAFGALREREHVKWTLLAFVAGSFISCVYGLLVPTAQTSAQAGRLTGTVGEANGEAIVIAAAIPLLIALAATKPRSPHVKLIAMAATVVFFIGLVSTLSREGLLALGAVMVGAVVFGGRWRAWAGMLLVVGAVGTVGYFFVLAPLTARNRVTASSTTGRSSIWTVAWRVIRTHPVQGVGTDNFPLVEGRYVNQPGAITSANLIVDTPKAAHDAALEALADLGVPGLLTMVAVWGGCFALAVKAARIFERLGDREMELLSRAVVLALIAVFVGDAFAPSQYAKYLWILLAVCPVLLSLARRGARLSGMQSQPVEPWSPATAGVAP